MEDCLMSANMVLYPYEDPNNLMDKVSSPGSDGVTNHAIIYSEDGTEYNAEIVKIDKENMYVIAIFYKKNYPEQIKLILTDVSFHELNINVWRLEFTAKHIESEV